MITHYEYRTSKTTVAKFDSEETARRWLEKWEQKNPAYAKSLKLVKITTYTYTQMEEIP